MSSLPDYPYYHLLIEWIAILVLLICLFKFWNFFYTYILGSTPNFSKYGDWSVVTGCTDGIGLAFAKQLAENGQNIVLMSRSPEKLKAVSSEIEKSYNVSTKQIVVDFAKADIYENVSKSLSGLNIGVLVNNVGMAFDMPDRFLDVNFQDLQNLLAVNMESLVKMTKLIMPAMVKKRKGVIINLSSCSAIHPTPYLGVYSASKQFVNCFSKSLHAEYAKSGVFVQSLMPMFVSTKMTGLKKTSLFVPTPDIYVKSTLKTVGRSIKTCGYIPHAFQAFLLSVLPEFIFLHGTLHFLQQTKERIIKRRKLQKSNQST